MRGSELIETNLKLMLEKSHREKEMKSSMKNRVQLASIIPDDPMSPYRRPRSRVYVDETIVDTVNTKQYKAFFPESFTFVPRYFKENNLVPFYKPISDAEYSKGVLTIAGMIELTDNNIPWRLYHDDDFDDILNIINEYREYLLSANNKNKQVVLYLGKVDRFIDEITRAKERMFSRVYKRRMLTNFSDIIKSLIGR